MRSRTKFLLGGFLCGLLAFGQATFLLVDGRNYHHTIQIAIGWGLGMSIAFCLLFSHVASFCCSSFISVQTVFIKYMIYWFFRLTKGFHWRTFYNSTKDCTSAQTAFLLKKLKENEETMYGTNFKFKDMSNLADFMQKHPLTTYEHYKDYIKRVANGELGVMSSAKPSILGKTSGTTGIAKMFPVSAKCMSDLSGSAHAVTTCFRDRLGVGKPSPLQMMSSLLTAGRISVSEGGIPMGSMTTFMMTDRIREVLFTTPVLVYNITHEPTAMYIHALFALRDENLGSIWAPFASSLYIFFRFLEISWHMLVQDIRCGCISDDLQSLSTNDRQELNQHLCPMPDRANELERQFRMGFEGIVQRLWPAIPVLYGVTSGSMQTFRRRLTKYTGGLNIVSGYYISTEGLMGYACELPEDGQTKYVCIPNGMFYEFIPADYCDEENPGTLLMGEVREGECYELVITNKDGLYRYRMGDVVKITGFFNTTPIFEFQYRNGELLNLRSEKTSEVSVTRALQETIEKWEAVQLVDYVCAECPLYEEAIGEDSDADVLYYVILVELSAPRDSELITHVEERKKFEAEFDANLRTSAVAYGVLRSGNKMGSPKVIFLDTLAFSEFRIYLLENSSASAGQLKIPRKLRKMEWVKLFIDHEIQCRTADMV